MDFDFSPEQKSFQDHLRRALEAACPLSETRRLLEGGGHFSAPAWRTLCDMGATAASIPSEYGGLGLGYYELCLAAEEAGRALAATPLSSSIFLAAEALMAAGGADEKMAWLPRLAAGSAIGCFADEIANAPPPVFRDGALHGASAPVADASYADLAIVAARRGDGEATLALVQLDQRRVGRTRLDTVDPSRDFAALSFDGAEAVELDSANTSARQIISDVRNRAAILTAFEQVGGAERALLMARDYALTRRTFGRQIGSYQAVKHKLADVYVKIENARAHAHYGAWALATQAPDLAAAAAAARVTATNAFIFAAQENIQTHGGIGFTWESDCQLFYRRSRLLASQLGDALRWKEIVVSELERAMTVQSHGL